MSLNDLNKIAPIFIYLLFNKNPIKLFRVVIAVLIFLFSIPINAKAFYNRALWIVRDHIITKKSADDIISFAETNDYNIL